MHAESRRCPSTDTAGSARLRALRYLTLAASAAALVVASAAPSGALSGKLSGIQNQPATAGPTPSDEGVTEWSVAGLEQPAEILVDRWGVPHLYARTPDDVYFVQGFNAARDRLWQLDLWKRRGEGRLAEVFGEDFVEQDRAARLLLFRGDWYREWLAYASDTKRIVSAFTAGVNAWIELTQRRPELLAPEFGWLDYRPAPWDPETVVRIRSHGLRRNLGGEVDRARFLREHGAAALALRDWFEPEHELTVPEGLDLEWITDDVLEVYRLGTAPVRFETPEPGPAGEQAAAMLSPIPPHRLLEEADLWQGEWSRGSNNWAIAGSRTASGRPIVADDPHRALEMPSLRYIVHLSGPGTNGAELDVIGAGEPALPGISIGHNGTIAFGLTIFSIDQEDLYVYETSPEDPDLYRHRGAWRRMEVVGETIEVKSRSPEAVELRFTHHGPVIHRDVDRNLAYALRAAWLEPGMAPYLTGIELMRAGDWNGFLAAMNRWGTPSENQVYADTSGHIGWKPGGLAPLRPNWDGLLPVPGDGRYEWQGFLDVDQMPVEADPERGWVATANQMNLPAGYPHQLGLEWATPYRYGRIAEVLDASREHRLEDSLRLQTDTLSIPARRVAAVLAGLPTPAADDPVHGSWTELAGFDARLTRDSKTATLFEIWWRGPLREELFWEIARRHDEIDDEAAEALVDDASAERVLWLLESPAPWLGNSDAEARDTLRSVIARSLVRTLENGHVGRTWGDLHRARLEHPLIDRAPETVRDELTVGPLPRAGSGETPGNTRYNSDFVQRSGASFRMIVDVGAWDRSLAMNSPGQSGDPRRPFFHDLFEPWANDEAFPLLYTRDAVEDATVERYRLTPLVEDQR